MKTKFLILLLSLGMAFSSQAQKSFKKGNVLLSPAVGLVNNYGYVGGRVISPSVFFSADFGVHDYVSVGPYVGATFFRGVEGFDFGARGNFHWWQLLDDKINADLKQSQLDIYATLWTGGQILRYSSSNKAGSFDIGFTQGVRWYPKSNKRFALMGEFGFTPIAYANIGATIKIGNNQ